MKIALALLASSALLAPISASAAPLLFTITGTTLQPSFTANFVFDTSASPTITNANRNIRYNGLTINYTLPGSTTVRTETAGAVFSLSGQENGGFNINRLNQAGNFGNGIFLYGPQIFSGTTANPGFAPGTFLLSDNAGNQSLANYRLVISQVAAVPEPATWGMMIAGFGMIGGALRRRSVRVRFA